MKIAKRIVLFSALTGLLASSAVSAAKMLDCLKLPANSEARQDCVKQVKQENREKVRERVKQRIQERAAEKAAADEATDTAETEANE